MTATQATPPRYVLVDGTNLIYRATYAIGGADPSRVAPDAAAKLAKGLIGKLTADEYREQHTIVVFDGGGTTWRHALYPGYKVGRKDPPPAIAPGTELLRDLLDAERTPNLSIPACEADDLIATLATAATFAGHPVTLVSSDADLLQLLDPDTTMLHIGPKVSVVTRHTPETFAALWGFPSHLLPHYKALAGDDTDKILGVNQVGQVYAKRLLAQFPGGIDAIYAGIDQVAAKALRANLITGEADARTCLILATLDRNVGQRHPGGCCDPAEAVALWRPA